MAWFRVDYRRWAREQGLPPLDRSSPHIKQNHSLHLATRRWTATSPGTIYVSGLNTYIPLPVQVEYDAVLEGVVGAYAGLLKRWTGTENPLTGQSLPRARSACHAAAPVEYGGTG